MNVRQAWLWLNNINGIGNRKISKLLGIFDSPLDVFNSTEQDLRQVIGLSAIDVNLIEKAKQNPDIKKYEEYFDANEIKYVTIQDKEYPRLLKNIFDPPSVLYYKGTLPSKDDVLLGVVGSRDCTEYGKKVTYGISKDLATAGVTVVSGMALGTDTYAHKGALDGKGKTIAVLGCGVDICYPRSNRDLMNEIIKNGAIISEYPPKTEPLPTLFPARNRIISGLSKGTLIVEAAARSGSLITADQALEQGREVFAIPGDITSSRSEGTNNLIKQGASLVTDYADIINGLGMKLVEVKKESIINTVNKVNNIEKSKEEKTQAENNLDKLLDEEEKIVYAGIDFNGSYIDDISVTSKFDISKLQHVLTMLELKGIIKQLPGKRFERLM